jgi:hypothetical protein
VLTIQVFLRFDFRGTGIAWIPYRCLRSPKCRSGKKRGGKTLPRNAENVRERPIRLGAQVRAVQIFYALTNQTGDVPPGPAVPPAVTESECGSEGLAQAPAAASSEATQDVLASPLSPKRVYSDSAGASDGGKRGSTQDDQASTSSSSEATAAVLVSPPSHKGGYSDSVGTSDGGRALSSPVISITVVRRSARSRAKKTTASPGAHSYGDCPVFISDFNCYGMPRQEHQRGTNKETGEEPRNRR